MKLHWVVGVAASMMIAVNGWAAPLFSDNFDSENGGNGQLNYTGFANWDVVSGTVDLIGNGFWDVLPGNGLYVDMDGTSWDAGSMVSKAGIALSPGSYYLSFSLAGNQREYYDPGPDFVTAQVNFGALYSETFSLSPYDPFTNYVRVVTVSEPVVVSLSFAATGGDNVGMLLDNVGLAAVPLPAASLAGLALLAGLGLRRRRG